MKLNTTIRLILLCGSILCVTTHFPKLDLMHEAYLFMGIIITFMLIGLWKTRSQKYFEGLKVSLLIGIFGLLSSVIFVFMMFSSVLFKTPIVAIVIGRSTEIYSYINNYVAAVPHKLIGWFIGAKFALIIALILPLLFVLMNRSRKSETWIKY